MSRLAKISFRMINAPFLRRAAEKNRRAVGLYFDWRYRRPDPYGYAGSAPEREKREHIKEFLGGRRYSRILEAGCGEGHMTGVLAGFGGSVVGMDISRKALSLAADRHRNEPRVSFLRADLMSYRPREKFGLVACVEMLYYLTPGQIEKAVLNLLPCMEDGGHLLSVNIFGASESADGLPLKAAGAGTIHPMLARMPGLHKLDVRRFPGYEMLLLEKR